MAKEVKNFEAETKKVLDLMINSIYTKKDIFLRELIANSADAIDKVRFLSLTKTELAEDWGIRIERDTEEGTIKIIDNGIGMTKEEVIENIGTIAESGSKAFLKALEEKQIKESPELIGEFGVGFYSAFMVADKIVVETKKADSDEPAVRWTSEGKGQYSIEEIEKENKGTTVTLHLKEEDKEYLEQEKIKEIVRKYSDYIEYPIKMKTTVKEPKEKEEGEKEEGQEGEESSKEPEYVDVEKDEILNSQKAIWLRSQSELKEEDYQQFYKHISHSFDDALKHVHYSAEGKTEFKALIYIPSKNPYNIFTPDTRKKTLQLYIKRVFITDECAELLPEYLRFVEGVVDSSDMPLNISRENLQSNPIIGQIKKNLVRKIINTLKNMKEKEPENYRNFFKEFGRFIKEGVHTDHENKEKLQELLMYESMNNESGQLISLKEYADAMPEGQKDIYYISGESRDVIENSPHLEMFRSKGYDVLYMTDPIDEFVVMNLSQYDGKDIKAVGKGDIDLSSEEEDKEKEDKEDEKSQEQEYSDLLKYLQQKLDEDVKEVRFSNRLTDSACCLVGDNYDQSAYMQRIMKAMNQEPPKTKRVLELNPKHSIVKSMKKLYDNAPDNEKLGEFAQLLYDQALLTEGSSIPDPLTFSKRLSDLMVTGLEEEVK